MRYPHEVSGLFDLSEVFSSDESSATLELSVLSSERLFLFISQSQEVELFRCAKKSPQIEHAIERLRRGSICVLPEAQTGVDSDVDIAGHEQGLLNRKLLNLPTLLASSQLQKEIRRHRNALNSSENTEEALTRIFDKHLSRASVVQVVDPYFFESIWMGTKPVNELFRLLVIASGRELIVHTKLPKRYDGEYLIKYLGREKTILGDANFRKFLTDRAQELTKTLHPDSELSIVFYPRRGFPHDRHLEVTFPDGTRPRGHSDYFALGGGFDTFSQEHYDSPNGNIRTQVYPSDSQRMWGWLTDGAECDVGVSSGWKIRVNICPSRDQPVEVEVARVTLNSWR